MLLAIAVAAVAAAVAVIISYNRQGIEGFTTAIMVVISVWFLPASYAIFVVKERAVKANYQQASRLSGGKCYVACSPFVRMSFLYAQQVFGAAILLTAEAKLNEPQEPD